MSDGESFARNTGVVVYLGDILLTGATKEDLQALDDVLKRLETAGLA